MENLLVETFGEPTASVTHVEIKGFGRDGLTLLAKVAVANPYFVPIPIGEIVYTVKNSGAGAGVIASGSIPDPGSLTANGSTVLDVTVKVPHNAILVLVEDIVGDWDIDYQLDLEMVVDLPVIGDVRIPFSHISVVKLPTLPELFFGKSEPAPQVVVVSETKKDVSGSRGFSSHLMGLLGDKRSFLMFGITTIFAIVVLRKSR